MTWRAWTMVAGLWGLAVTGGCDGPDRDGDGLSDAFERAGWRVVVENEYGRREKGVVVTSDPGDDDTDDDGLLDSEEAAALTDPRSPDTDADGVSDFDELRIYASNPRDVDSDDDARGPKGDATPHGLLFDGTELQQVGTSPTLADTDGDGKTDYTEVIGSGFDPLVADIPKVDLRVVGSPRVTLVLDCTETEGETTDEFSAELRSQSTKLATSDTQATKSTTRAKVSTSVEGSYSPFPPRGSIKAKASASLSKSMTRERTTSISAESAREAQSEHRESRSYSSNRECRDGNESQLSVAFTVENVSDRTFTLRGLTITALMRSPFDPTDFVPVTTLVPDLGCQSIEGEPCEIIMAPGGRSGTLAASANDLPGSLVRELLANPAGLFFEVATYRLLVADDETDTDRDFPEYADAVTSRNAMVVIDYGSGRFDDNGESNVETHLVSTNVFRQADGSPEGITVTDALAILGIPYETEAFEGSGQQVLASVDGVGDADGKSGWVVFGSGDAFEDPAVDFGDQRLFNRDRLTMVYLTDQDGDGLYAREEHLFGTSDERSDTDGDGLDDAIEAQEGWVVNLLSESFVVYSIPTLVDSDDDGVRDAEERERGTDPLEVDTDFDGLTDDIDPNPRAPEGTAWYQLRFDRLELVSADCDSDEAITVTYGFDFQTIPGGNDDCGGISGQVELFEGGAITGSSEPICEFPASPDGGGLSIRGTADGFTETGSLRLGTWDVVFDYGTQIGEQVFERSDDGCTVRLTLGLTSAPYQSYGYQYSPNP